MNLDTITLIFGTGLFFIGITGVLIRRNAIVVLMCIELILNGVNLTFITFSHIHGNLAGQVAAIFVIVVAAAEAAVGLAIVIAVFRRHPSINIDEFNVLKW
ncbi:MAG: NADH-quinone oxidoreductase subunit NuoK [Candidatus Omnitrophica bacterium]|nr:NADH-quinone oxidoreductase subunit NuoK [Candidatus Omnitrophota bacterium]